jgi:MFS family permease
MNSINLGFDIGVNTDVGPSLLASDLLNNSAEKLELFMGSLNLWAILGAFLASLLADQLGRRKSFAVASVGFIIGVACMATAHSFAQLMVGRVLIGLGCGFGFAVDPVYISEISPAHARGRLVTWSEIGTNIGILVGWCAGYALKDLPPDVSWRAMLGTGCILPMVMLVLVAFVMPESPRWLIRMGRVPEAKEVLVLLYPPGEDIDAVVRTIEDNIAVETRESGSITWHQMFHPTPALKRMLVVGIGVAVCQQLVGIDAIQYFLLFIMSQSGITSCDDQFKYLIMIGVLKLSCIFVAGALFDSMGRRPLMFTSCAGMAGATLLLAGHMYSLPDEATTEACTDSDGASDDTAGIPPDDCVSWNDGCNTCDVKG